jgi:hypothetical protein
VVDHLDGAKDHNAPENLVPSCHTCNWKRGLFMAWVRLHAGDPVIAGIFADGRGLAPIERCGSTPRARSKGAIMNFILEGPTGARVLSLTVPGIREAPDAVLLQGRTYRWRGALADGVTYREATTICLDGHLPGGTVVRPEGSDPRWERA